MITEDEVMEAARRLRVVLEKMLDPGPGRMPTHIKGCSTCGEVKFIDEFYRFHRSRDGRVGRCKSCFLKRREELKVEGVTARTIGKSATTDALTVTSESELRAALKTGEVFHT